MGEVQMSGEVGKEALSDKERLFRTSGASERRDDSVFLQRLEKENVIRNPATPQGFFLDWPWERVIMLSDFWVRGSVING
jgi:hypothetical protein